MKGMIFTEFMEMVDSEFGAELTEKMLEASKVPSGGIYTAVGTYDHGELLTLVHQLSQETAIPVPDLVRSFGRHLFGRFVKSYARFFQGVDSTFQFLAQVDDHVHVEVLKLYPEAELPKFTSQRLDDNRMIFDYRSRRPFGDLAEGLILGCAEHYGESLQVQRQPLPAESGTAIRFLLTRLD
jgi:hypothetical protein